jgi:hypothetical protein
MGNLLFGSLSEACFLASKLSMWPLDALFLPTRGIADEAPFMA